MFQSFMESLLKELPLIAIRIVFLGIVIILFPRIINYFLHIYQKTLDRKNVDPLFKSFSHSFLKTVGYVVLFFIGIEIFGIKGTSLITVLGTAGLAIGLALQGSLSNLAGGMLILFFRPFLKGEYIISSSGAEGTVDQIFILYTHLITVDGKLVVVPNSELVNSTITNFTRTPERRLDITVSVVNETSIDKIQEILTKISEEYPTILQDKPKTLKLFKQNIGYMDFLFRVWVKNEDYWNSLFDLNEVIKKSLDANGIEMPYQRIELYDKSKNYNKN